MDWKGANLRIKSKRISLKVYSAHTDFVFGSRGSSDGGPGGAQGDHRVKLFVFVDI